MDFFLNRHEGLSPGAIRAYSRPMSIPTVLGWLWRRWGEEGCQRPQTVTEFKENSRARRPGGGHVAPRLACWTCGAMTAGARHRVRDIESMSSARNAAEYLQETETFRGNWQHRFDHLRSDSTGEDGHKHCLSCDPIPLLRPKGHRSTSVIGQTDPNCARDFHLGVYLAHPRHHGRRLHHGASA